MSKVSSSALAAVAALVLSGAAVAAENIQQLVQEYPIGEARSVSVDFPVGNLRVEAGGDPIVRVEMQISCESSVADCAAVAEKMKIDSRADGRDLAVKIKGPRGTSAKGVRLSARVLAPRTVTLSVDMGVGNLSVSDFERDLYLEVGVGNADVTLNESSVRSVKLDAGVGDVSLSLKNGRIDGEGFVSQGLKWSNGAGTANVEIECGVGDVVLTLR